MLLLYLKKTLFCFILFRGKIEILHQEEVFGLIREIAPFRLPGVKLLNISNNLLFRFIYLRKKMHQSSWERERMSALLSQFLAYKQLATRILYSLNLFLLGKIRLHYHAFRFRPHRHSEIRRWEEGIHKNSSRNLRKIRRSTNRSRTNGGHRSVRQSLHDWSHWEIKIRLHLEYWKHQTHNLFSPWSSQKPHSLSLHGRSRHRIP